MASARVKQLCILLTIVCCFTALYMVSRHGTEFSISKVTLVKLQGRKIHNSTQNSNSIIETQTYGNKTKFATKANIISGQNNILDPGGNHLVEYLPAKPPKSIAEDPEEKFAARRDLVKKSCQRYDKLASYREDWQRQIFKRLRWLKKRDLVVCFSAKVGTSTWLGYLLQDRYPSEYLKWKQKSNSQQHVIAAHYLEPQFPDQLERVTQQLLNSSKVLNVRHPFVRIVSAYRDKFEPCLSQRNCYAKTAVKEWESLLTFKSFVEYLVREIPVFTETNIKTFYLFDAHWRPYYLNCAVCNIDYDYIVKMETWDEDIRYILTKFGFKQEEYLHDNRKNSDAVALEYVRALPQALIIELHKRYAIDFEMFGYKVDKYLE